jgi:hypothetical protein
MRMHDVEHVDMIIRQVPRWLRKAIKMLALKEDKAMNILIIELMTKEVAEKGGEK